MVTDQFEDVTLYHADCLRVLPHLAATGAGEGQLFGAMG
jgi:hypothetical protein